MVWLVFVAGCVGLQAVPSGDGLGAGGATVGGVSLSASSVDFGDVEVGSVADEAFVLTNGDGSLVHINASVSGEGFSADQVGFDLVRAGEQVITLEFSPADLGEFAGELTLTIGQETTRVPLSGAGVEEGGGDTDTGGGGGGEGGELTTDMPSLAFGTLDLGASLLKQVTVSNTGTGPLTVSAATSSDVAFVLGGNLTPPRTLDPGDERVVEVTFTPTAARAYSGNLVLTSDDGSSPKTTIAMTGTGEDQCDVCSPRIDVNTGSSSDYEITDFSSWAGSKDSRTVTIGNDGDEDLEVSTVSVKNDFLQPCGTFSVSGFHGPATVAPGRTTTFTVSYVTNDTCLDVPQKTIDANVVHILSNDPAESDYVIELGGVGISF